MTRQTQQLPNRSRAGFADEASFSTDTFE